ncbi:hypothetical protein ABVK25_012380 [Lepraria finkii]|uniref:Uncharacterized protein n=1 Tax=Lepraria finkii TaxID=1340010 RepID=A0ABR4AIS8_9LECA
MMSLSRTVAPRALRASSSIPYNLIRATPIASISSSSSKSATSVTPAVPSTSNDRLPITGRVRREVPLPSQEPKKGAMQYALTTLSTQSPTGPAKAPSGP